MFVKKFKKIGENQKTKQLKFTKFATKFIVAFERVEIVIGIVTNKINESLSP